MGKYSALFDEVEAPEPTGKYSALFEEDSPASASLSEGFDTSLGLPPLRGLDDIAIGGLEGTDAVQFDQQTGKVIPILRALPTPPKQRVELDTQGVDQFQTRPEYEADLNDNGWEEAEGPVSGVITPLDALPPSDSQWINAKRKFEASTAEGTADAIGAFLKAGRDLDQQTGGIVSGVVESLGVDPSELSRSMEQWARERKSAQRFEKGVNPELEDTISAKLAGAAGSLPPVIVGSMVNPALGAVVGGGMMAESERQQAQQAGATQGQQDTTFYSNAVVGTLTERLLGVSSLWKAARKAGMPQEAYKSVVRHVAEGAARGYIREGTQETLEQAAANEIAKTIAGWDADRDRTEGLAESFLIGGAVGAPVGVVGQAGQGRGGARAQEAMPAERAAAQEVAPRADMSDTPPYTVEEPRGEIPRRNRDNARTDTQQIRDSQPDPTEDFAARQDVLIPSISGELESDELTPEEFDALIEEEVAARMAERGISDASQQQATRRAEPESSPASEFGISEQLQERERGELGDPQTSGRPQREEAIRSESERQAISQEPSTEAPRLPLSPESSTPSASSRQAPELQPAEARGSFARQEGRAPELMTPDEFISARVLRPAIRFTDGEGGIREGSLRDIHATIDVGEASQRRPRESGWIAPDGRFLSPNEAARIQGQGDARNAYRAAKQEHSNAVTRAVLTRQPVSAAAMDAYQSAPPRNYVRRGDQYVYEDNAPVFRREESTNKNIDTRTGAPQSARSVDSRTGQRYALPDDVRQSAQPDTKLERLQLLAGFRREVEKDPARAGRGIRGPSKLQAVRWADSVSSVEVGNTGRGRPYQVAVAEDLAANAPTRRSVEIVWFRDPAGEGYDGGVLPQNPNVLFINVDAQGAPVYTVVAHELTHAMEQEAPEIYEAYARAIIAEAKNRGAYDENRIRRGYTRRQLNAELVADFTADAIANPARLQVVLGKNPTLWQRVIGFFKQYINRLERKIEARRLRKIGLEDPPTASDAITDLRAAHRAMERAFREWHSSRRTDAGDGLSSMRPETIIPSPTPNRRVQFARSTNPRAIDRAAIRMEDGAVWVGRTHAEAAEGAEFGKYTRDDIRKSVSGFVTNEGEFLTRRQAETRAAEVGQLAHDGQEGLEAEDFTEQRRFSRQQPSTRKEEARALIRQLIDENDSPWFKRQEAPTGENVNRVKEWLKQTVMPPQQAGLPVVDYDTSNPLPDFLEYAKSKPIFSQGWGAENLPVLGKLYGGRFNARDPIMKAVATWHGEQGVGRAIASALRVELGGTINKPFKVSKDGDLDIATTSEGQSKKIGDVFEALRKDENAYKLTPEQRSAWNKIKPLLDRMTALKRQYGLIGQGEDFFGEDYVDAYFPRIVTQEPKREKGGGDAPRAGSSRVGAKQFFQKERAFRTEAEGWKRGYKYETDIEARLVKSAERMYKAIADKRLAADPDLGGRTRKGLVSELLDSYFDDIVEGRMTQADVKRIAEAIERRGSVHQPAFAKKIFDEDVANTLNKAFPQANGAIIRAIVRGNNFSKGLALGFDLGVGQIQGLHLLLSAPIRPRNGWIWAKAQMAGFKELAKPGSFSKYANQNRAIIREMAQMGASVGQLQEMMQGVEKGELLTKIPVVGMLARRFGGNFSAFLDVAKVELYKSWRDVEQMQEMPKVVQAIESMLGNARMESVGLAKSRIVTERALLLAPSYYRGGVNLVAGMAEKGVSGTVARRAMASTLR